MDHLTRPDLSLHIVDEAQAFTAVADVVALRRRAPSGAWLERVTEPPRLFDGDFTTRLGGDAAPPPGALLDHARCGATRLFRLDDTLVLPRLGAVIGSGGAVGRIGSGEALHRWPDMAGWPDVTIADGAARFRPRGALPEIERAALFMPWGADFNYGHFLIDGLCGLLAMQEAGLLGEFLPISGPLWAWQREAIAATFGDLLAPRTLRARAVRVREVLYTGCMDHFLHAPNGLLGRLAERFRAVRPRTGAKGRRVYLSRRGLSMRVMINEVALEQALRQRGFEIVQPERLSFTAQSRLMAETELLVGPTGAGLANALLLPAGVKVVEIQPANFTSHWLYSLSREVGVDWFGYYCASPAPRNEAPWLARMRRGFRFGYHLPLQDFLGFLDAVR